MGRKKLEVENLRGYWFAFVFRDKGPDFEKYLNELLIINAYIFKHYFYIYHDKDTSKTKHYHVIINTCAVRTLGFMSKYFNIDINDIELIDIPNKMIRYLIHVDNPEKEQYSYTAIRTDYSSTKIRALTEPLTLKKKDNDKWMLYIINLINTHDICSFYRLVDVLANNGETELMSYVMGKKCYSITCYINSRNMANYCYNKSERKE